jgi:uroporphyrinogen-III decarboxylase
VSVTIADEFLPVELVFNPNWWYQTAGIVFNKAFYFDAATRVQNDIVMRRVLNERYADLGLGESDPQPRPVAGSLHVAGGFVIPALLGAEIIFAPDAAPQPKPLDLSLAQIEALEKPDFRSTWPMDELIASMDVLEAQFGYLEGDLNTDGLLNAAYHLYGEQLFLDFYQAPRRVRRLLDIIADLIVDVALYVRQRTGSCSISVNRMVKHVDPGLFLHGNCSVQMISPKSYRQMHLPVEQRMARRAQPFGIHHCGDNLHRIAPLYAELPAIFYGVGWGSDLAQCRRALPDAFFNLRLNPVRMLQCTPQDIAEDTERLLLAAGPLERAGVCCINMDYGTPDDNILAMFKVVQRYQRYGA